MSSVIGKTAAKIAAPVLTKVAGTAISGLLGSKKKSASQTPMMSEFNMRMPSGQIVKMMMPTGGTVTEGPKTTTGDILGDALQGGTDALVTSMLTKSRKNLQAKSSSSEWGDSGKSMPETTKKLMNYSKT